jgi:hypothetical protein
MSRQTGVSKLESTQLLLLKWTILYNHFARATQKTQSLSFWEGGFTAPSHSNESYSIVACVFVAARMCLPSHCLTMNVYPDFVIPTFGRRVTILLTRLMSEYTKINYTYYFAVSIGRKWMMNCLLEVLCKQVVNSAFCYYFLPILICASENQAGCLS